LRVAALDLFGFPSRLPRGVTCSAVHESGATWGPREFEPSDLDDAVGLLEGATFPREGAWWVSVRGDGLDSGWDLPVRVAESPRTLRWGDLHWHTNRSDGSRSPQEGYVYARDIVGLDFTAKTDHDYHARHPCLDERSWNETIELAKEYEAPGEFAALVAWEYTWNSGHHNVYFRGLDGPYLPVSQYPEIEGIWEKLTPGEAITIPHHPASTKQPHMRWEHRDARFQTVVEIFSNKGNSEAPTGPLTTLSRRDPRENPSRPGSAQEGWSLGASFGVIGSTDTHYSVPGAPIRVRNALDDQYDAGPGICAMWIDTLDRESVFDALLAGDTYATTGPRIRVEFDAHVEEGVLRSCSGDVIGAGEIESVEVIGIPRDGPAPFPVVASVPIRPSLRHVEFDGIPLTGVADLRGVYLRVTQKDSEMAWSSPVFVESEGR
jgi:hypothetical protein